MKDFFLKACALVLLLPFLILLAVCAVIGGLIDFCHSCARELD